MIFLNARRSASRAERATLGPMESALRGVQKNHSSRKSQRENKRNKKLWRLAPQFLIF